MRVSTFVAFDEIIQSLLVYFALPQLFEVRVPVGLAWRFARSAYTCCRLLVRSTHPRRSSRLSCPCHRTVSGASRPKERRTRTRSAGSAEHLRPCLDDAATRASCTLCGSITQTSPVRISSTSWNARRAYLFRGRLLLNSETAVQVWLALAVWEECKTRIIVFCHTACSRLFC